MSGRKLKSWEGWVIRSAAWGIDARHPDGRSTMQVHAAVRAPSMRAAADALGVGVSHVRNYMSETGNSEALEMLDAHPPLTVLLRPMDPGGTLNGQTGWVAATSGETEK